MANAPRLLLISFLIALGGCAGAKYPKCDGDKDCKPGEKCVNKQCAQCATTADCPAGSTCAQGKCLKKTGFCNNNEDCENGMVCRLNACVFCQNDNDCGAGGKCKGGRCLKPGACIADDDCPEDQDCVGNLCQKAGASGLPVSKAASKASAIAVMSSRVIWTPPRRCALWDGPSSGVWTPPKCCALSLPGPGPTPDGPFTARCRASATAR